MAKVIAIMSMSLDGYVADANDGVAEVFAWYTAGDVDVPNPSSDFTFHVSAASARHLRALMSEVGAMLTGRRTFDLADGWGGQHPWRTPAFVVTHHLPPPSPPPPPPLPLLPPPPPRPLAPPPPPPPPPP